MNKRAKPYFYIILIFIAIGAILIANLDYWEMIRYVQGDFSNNGELILRYEYGRDHVIDKKQLESNRVYTDRELFINGVRYLYLRGAVVAPSINQVYSCFYSNYPYSTELDNTILFKLVSDKDYSSYDGWVDKTNGIFGNVLRVWFKEVDIREDEAYTIEVYRIINEDPKLIRRIPLPGSDD